MKIKRDNKTTKIILIGLLMISSSAAFFMDNYNIVFDHHMIQNMVETNYSEASDLLSFKLFCYILLLGVTPSLFVYRLKITYFPLKKSFIHKMRNCVISLLILFVMVFSLSKFYTSFVSAQ